MVANLTITGKLIRENQELMGEIKLKLKLLREKQSLIAKYEQLIQEQTRLQKEKERLKQEIASFN